MKLSLHVLACLLLLSSFSYPQNKFSVQINGGIVSPFEANSGLGYGFQLNYNYTHNNSLFLNISNSSWDRNNLVFNEKGITFNEHNEENHSLFSIFLGDRLTFYRIK